MTSEVLYEVDDLRMDLEKLEARVIKLEEAVKELTNALQQLAIGKALSEVLKARNERPRREKK